MEKKITQETIEAQRAECLSLLTVWAEETELKLRRRGVAFTPKEREAMDAAKAKLAMRIKKQDRFESPLQNLLAVFTNFQH